MTILMRGVTPTKHNREQVSVTLSTCDDITIAGWLTRLGATAFTAMLAMSEQEALEHHGVPFESHRVMRATFTEHSIRCRACALQVNDTKLPRAYQR